jgi:hypothetical protein
MLRNFVFKKVLFYFQWNSERTSLLSVGLNDLILKFSFNYLKSTKSYYVPAAIGWQICLLYEKNINDGYLLSISIYSLRSLTIYKL